MIHVDHYMCEPIEPFDDTYSDFLRKPTRKVPIIRIFGVNENGIKICLHIHGFYPYICIKNEDTVRDELVVRRMIVNDIEKGLQTVMEERATAFIKQRQNLGSSSRVTEDPSLSERENEYNLGYQNDRVPTSGEDDLHGNTYRQSPVHNIEPIKTIHYYGYHAKEEKFFKLYLYNPNLVKRIYELFETCRVLGKFLPVFWAHIPYILLFFIDNNLRGMQFIELNQIFYRKDRAPPLRPDDRQNTTLDGDFISEIMPTSTCQLEADARVEWILNGQQFGANGNDTALKELWMDQQPPSQSSQIRRGEQPIYDLERSYIQQLYNSVGYEMPSEPSHSEHNRNTDQNIEDSFVSDNSDNQSTFQNFDEDLFESDDEFLMEAIKQVEARNPELTRSRQEINQNINQSFLQDNSRIDNQEEEDDHISLESDLDEEIIYDDASFSSNSPSSSQLASTSQQGSPSLSISGHNSALRDRRLSIDFSLASIPELREKDSPIKGKGSNIYTSTQLVSPTNSINGATLPRTALVKRAFTPNANDTTPKQNRKSKRPRFNSDNSMIDGVSLMGSLNRPISQQSFSSNTTSQSGALAHEYQNMCIMSLEIHVNTRGDLKPNPKLDSIEVVFYCINNDVPDGHDLLKRLTGIIIVESSFEGCTSSNQSSQSDVGLMRKRNLTSRTGLSMQHDITVHRVESEIELLMTLVDVVKNHDPEILLGFEMEMLSWGYILERSEMLNINISAALSRIIDDKLARNSKEVDPTFVQPIMFSGRMVFSTWRIVRHDINMNTCSYERLHHHCLKERIPAYSFKVLTQWYQEDKQRWRVLDYYLIRTVGQMRILDTFDLVAKISELARVYGTQFIDVITRGSQIGIESMMLRLAKLQNLTPLSPTTNQRNRMKAPESLPLVMEPESNIYYDPVAVLDFQSLYPSVVIAYNYCYSTCLGRVTDIDKNQRHQFGCSQLHVEHDEIKKFLSTNSVHVSPCGVAYVKKDIRHGVLPKMLHELITTRAMVKDQMKENMRSAKPNRRLQRILDHRQHGLKMMANTTYGYTGASYTGRMPCVEIADSIVSKGRETLEKAIDLVESKSKWQAKVIYGDTDSIFIQFPNCDRQEAFKRAYEMVEAITESNPSPIKMKFEKIYQPCVLQTKKRYCGLKYESPGQVKPEFEAKGIETVRRDCCLAASRMLEMALRIQFETRDVNEVKKYVQHQFLKIMSGKLSNIHDFIFARQYKPRGMEKEESVFVPAGQITKRLLSKDPRAEPRFKERIPYVIVFGEPNTPLVHLARPPVDLLKDPSLRINSDYYIQKIICPTLNRIFNIVKVDTHHWYREMPKKLIVNRSHYLMAQKALEDNTTNCAANSGFGGVNSGANRQSTMSQYFSPSHCPICAKSVPLDEDTCDDCKLDAQGSVIRLSEEIARNQMKLLSYRRLCMACSSLEPSTANSETSNEASYHNPCISYDCLNLFRYHQAKLDVVNSNYLIDVLKFVN